MKHLTKIGLFAGLMFIHLHALSQVAGTGSFPKIGYTNVDLMIARLPEKELYLLYCLHLRKKTMSQI